MASARQLEQDIFALIETLLRLVKSFRVHEAGDEGGAQVRPADLVKAEGPLRS